MKNHILLYFFILISVSCAPKVYFFEAHKLGTPKEDVAKNEDVEMACYFAGDALDYVVFEIDVINNSQDTLDLSYRHIFLEIFEKDKSRPRILDALSPDDVLTDLQHRHVQLQQEKAMRDIGNAIDIGFSLFLLGSGGGYGAINSLLFMLDSASYMLEDARAHKLLTGSLEEQMAYVEEWVLARETLGPGEEDSWDILFPRQLHSAYADFVVRSPRVDFRQGFELSIREERVR